MTVFDAKETVDLVAAIGASTLPSPARRCPLQFNPFLDPARPQNFRVVVYNSQNKFQRVVMEGSSDNFPSQLPFQKNISMTTSGESAWELNTLASLSSDAHNTDRSSSRTSSVVPGQGRTSNGENVMKSCFIPKNDVEKQCEETNGELSPLSFCASNAWIRDMTTSLGYREMHASSSSPRSVVNIEKSHAFKSKTEIEAKRFGVDTQRTPSNGMSRNETVENDTSFEANKTHNDGGDKDRNLSKKGSLRKLLSLGRGGSDDAPSKKNSLRKMLRKTSRTLLVNILDGGKSTDVDAHDERQAVRKGKRSTPQEERAQKREVKKDCKADDSGSRSVPNGVCSTSSDNEFEKLITRHALHVEKYLDDLASP